MARVSRLAGGGYFASKIPSTAPEIVFGLAIGAVSYFLWESWWIAAVTSAWSYMAMEAGHGNAYHMGTEQYLYPPRRQRLDAIILPLCKLFKFENRSPGYCWLFMGLKGLLIGLPLGLYGLPLAILWPLAYYLSFKYTQSSEYGEHLSGAFAGLLLEIVILTHMGVIL